MNVAHDHRILSFVEPRLLDVPERLRTCRAGIRCDGGRRLRWRRFTVGFTRDFARATARPELFHVKHSRWPGPRAHGRRSATVAPLPGARPWDTPPDVAAADRSSRDTCGAGRDPGQSAEDRSAMTLLLAAIGATVTAIVELTVGHTCGWAMPSRISSSSLRSSGRSRSASRAASSGRSSGASPRCPRTAAARITAFALLIVVGSSGAIARLLVRCPPVVAVLGHCRPESRLLDDPLRALSTPAARHRLADPIGRPPAGRRLRHHPRVLSGRSPSRSTTARRSGAGRLVNGYVYDRRPTTPTRPPLAIPRVRPRGRHLSSARLDGPALLPPGRQRRPSSRRSPRATERTSSRSRRPRPDLRPQRARRWSRTCRRSRSRSGRPTCPSERRDEVVARLAALLGMDRRRHQRRDRRQPGLARSISFGSPRTSRSRPRSLISEAGFELPGVEVAVEARRQYTDGRARCRRSSATRVRSRRAVLELRRRATCPTT